MSDFGLVPLSLLEAEAEVEEVAGELPSGSSVDAIEDETPNAVEAVVEIIETLPEEILTPDVEDDISIPSTPPAVEMLDKAEDDILPAEPSEAAIEEPRPESPILPKGFAAGRSVVEPEPVILQPKLSWFQRLRNGLARTSSQLTSQITALFTKRKLDDETLQDLEDLLIQADLGVETAMRVTDTLASERYGKDVTGEDVSRIMASEIAKVLKPVARPLQLDLSHKPHVTLILLHHHTPPYLHQFTIQSSQCEVVEEAILHTHPF
jgi:fused signal recognition particle receptor